MSRVPLKAGDIFFTDNFRTASKIVKFLMTAPTIYQHLWRKIRGTQEEVRFYHAGMITDPDTMIEQQTDVRYGNSWDIRRKNFVVWRNKKLSKPQREKLVRRAKKDLGKGYDWLLCIGKLFTWLTGINIFQRRIELAEKEICVTRVAKWYKDALGIKFGRKTHHEITTKIIDEYCQKHPATWEQVEIKYET